MDYLRITNGVEYALYALAIKNPSLFQEAERFGGGMAEDQTAARRVRDLLTKYLAEQYGAILGA